MIMPSRIKGAVSYKKDNDCKKSRSRSHSCSRSKSRSRDRRHGC
jgi:hypothetical protein